MKSVAMLGCSLALLLADWPAKSYTRACGHFTRHSSVSWNLALLLPFSSALTAEFAPESGAETTQSNYRIPHIGICPHALVYVENTVSFRVVWPVGRRSGAREIPACAGMTVVEDAGMTKEIRPSDWKRYPHHAGGAAFR